MAQITLTQRTIAGLKTTQRNELFWDKDFRDGGFAVRVSITGKKVFVFDYRNENGRQCRITIGDVSRISLADARAEARKIYADAKRGKDAAAERRKQKNCPTLAKVVEDFIPTWFAKLSPKTAYDVRLRLKNYILPKFGHRRVGDISRDDITEFLTAIGIEQGAPVQADRLKEVLRKLFNHALNLGHIAANPAAKIESFQTKEQKDGRTRHLSDDEIAGFWAATEEESQPIRALFRLILLTDQRSGEVCRARWEDIAFDSERWEFPKTKSGNIQVIPLTPLMIAELKDLRRANEEARTRSRLADTSHYSEFLFPSPRSKKKGALHIRNIAKACDRIEARMNSKFTPHDLRRSGATVMRRLKESAEIVQKILNHRPKSSQIKCLERYDRYDELPEMRQALGKLSDHVYSLAKSRCEADDSKREGDCSPIQSPQSDDNQSDPLQ